MREKSQIKPTFLYVWALFDGWRQESASGGVLKPWVVSRQSWVP